MDKLDELLGLIEFPTQAQLMLLSDIGDLERSKYVRVILIEQEKLLSAVKIVPIVSRDKDQYLKYIRRS